MGPCGEEAAGRARDTACPAPPPAVGAQGLGSKAVLSAGGLLSCPGLWEGPWAPAGCREVGGLVPAALFPAGLLHQGSPPGEGGNALPSQGPGAERHISETLPLSHLPATPCSSAKPWALPGTQVAPGDAHGHRVTQRCAQPPKAGGCSQDTHTHVQMQDGTPPTPARSLGARPRWPPRGPRAGAHAGPAPCQGWRRGRRHVLCAGVFQSRESRKETPLEILKNRNHLLREEGRR